MEPLTERETPAMDAKLTIDPAALELAETLLGAVYASDAAGGQHAYEDRTYGAVRDALVVCLTVAVEAAGVESPRAGLVAARLVGEATDNAENIAYQIGLWNDGIITL